MRIINPYSFTGGGGGGGFAPTDIAGCVLWTAADEITGLNDGDAVATWPDLSGNANDLNQGTSGNRPTYQTNELNGLPIIRFDATDDFLELASFSSLFSSAATAIYVLKPIAGNVSWFYTGGDSNHGDAYFGSSYLCTFQSSGRRDSYDNPTIGSYSIFSTVASTTFQRFINGTGGATPAITFGFQSTDLRIGYSGSFAGNCDIAEIIVYNTALGTTDREAVEDYLATKYGL